MIKAIIIAAGIEKRYSFCSKDLKILVMRIEGKISEEVKMQLSQIGKKNIRRIIFDNLQWFKS